MIKTAPFIAPLFALTLMTSPAEAFRAQNDMRVSQDGTGFLVSYTGGRAGVTDFWCAAGDYVLRALDRPGATRIYRLTGVPRRAGEAMRFSLSPEGAKPTGLVRLFGDKRSVGAAQARFFCDVTQQLRD